jgi:hypothetical protein
MGNDAVLHDCWHRFCLHSMLKIAKTYGGSFTLRGYPLFMRWGSHVECCPLRAAVAYGAGRKPYMFRVMGMRSDRAMSVERGELRIGTSGYHYDHWKELFYPRNLPKKSWFAYYARYVRRESAL